MSNSLEKIPPAKRISMTGWIVIGLLAGLFCGLFFGEYTIYVKWIGDAYVGLLQMAVLPYVAVSLIANVGSLSPKDGVRLLKVSAAVMVFLWSVGVLALLIMGLCFPEWESGSFFSSRFNTPAEIPNWLELFIPSNPFRSLSENSIPAVVVFCIGLGIAFMALPNKNRFIEPLNVLVDALAQLNKLVVKLTPIGLFAIVAHTSGSIDLSQFSLIQGYVLPYGAVAILLSFVILPAVLAILTPLSFGEVSRASRDPLVTAFVIGNSFVVLPIVIESVDRLMKEYHERSKLNASETAIDEADYLVALAYPFPDIGRIVGLVFIPFAAWFYGSTIPLENIPPMLGFGVLGAFAKPVLTIPSLLDIAELPSDIFDLWLASGVLAARFGDLMKTMHLIAFSILTIACLNRVLRIQPVKILLGAVIMLLILLGTALAIRAYLDVGFKDRYSREQLITERKMVFPTRFQHVGKTPMTIVSEGAPHPQVPGKYLSRVARIRAEGKIRVGFYPQQLPFSYFNNAGQLIGMDVQMAMFLANDLEVALEMVPIRPGMLEAQLTRNEFDVAMSAIEGTVMRAERFPGFAPYMFVTMAIVAPDHYAVEFRNVDMLVQVPDLKLACLKKGYFYDRLPRIFADRMSEDAPPGERITLVPLDSVSDFFDGTCEKEHGEVHVLLINAEAGSAWTLRYPRFTVTNPLKGAVKIPLYYLTDHDELFADFLRNWFALRKADGAFQWVYDYWILGYEPQQDSQRWSILKDVIGWNG